MREFPISDEQPIDLNQLLLDLGFTVLPEPANGPQPERKFVERVTITGVIRAGCNNGASNEDIRKAHEEVFTDMMNTEFGPIPCDDLIDAAHWEITVTVEDA